LPACQPHPHERSAMHPEHHVPESVRAYLHNQRELLQRGAIRALRLTPLVLSNHLHVLLRRRSLLFDEWDLEETPFGCQATFLRRLHSGRRVRGCFGILNLGSTICLLASSLHHDADANGPGYLVEHSHPLARKPFVGSSTLRRLLLQMAQRNKWEPLVVRSEGYERVTGEYRLDAKRQPIADAFEEMVQQGREMHRVTVRFRHTDGGPSLRAAFSREGKTTVLRGEPLRPLRDFLLRVCDLDGQEARARAVEFAALPLEQTAVRLDYDLPVFTGRARMEALVRATRRASGLNVTVLHLNPYLQAQVVDFYSGGTVDMVVMDQSAVSLIPRTPGSQPALDRVAETVFRFFGEAEAVRVPVRQQ
jgi:hypothetical protein